MAVEESGQLHIALVVWASRLLLRLTGVSALPRRAGRPHHNA